MKILCIADTEQSELWDHWNTAGKRRLQGIDLILSAGDLKSAYLEFLVTMTGVPCLYVRGNHDGYYDVMPPQGCVCIEDCIADVYEDPESGRAELLMPFARFKRDRVIRIAGLGGSMRYHEGPDMYTEKEMARRARRLIRKSRHDIDILLTHAPCLGYGDMDDLPHRGFACFNEMLGRTHPMYHCYGHVHMEYGLINREIPHPSGTRLINVSGMYILEI